METQTCKTAGCKCGPDCKCDAGTCGSLECCKNCATNKCKTAGCKCGSGCKCDAGTCGTLECCKTCKGGEKSCCS